MEASAAPGSYLTLHRTWKAGDRVEMELPMHLHVETMPDDPQLQAFLLVHWCSPDLGADGLTNAHIVGPNLRVFPNVEQNGSPLAAVNRTPPIPDLEIPTLRAAGPDAASWITPTDKPQVSGPGDRKGCHAGSAEQPVRPGACWQVEPPQS